MAKVKVEQLTIGDLLLIDGAQWQVGVVTYTPSGDYIIGVERSDWRAARRFQRGDIVEVWQQ